MSENLIDTILKEKLDEMQNSIDNDVMRALLVEGGWTQVEFRYKDRDHVVDVQSWCATTFKENSWTRLNEYYVFRKKKDAEWFMLRWL